MEKGKDSPLPREMFASQDETTLAGSAKCRSPGGSPPKPLPSYVALIANAILSSPGKKLNLSSIYRAVEDSFPEVGSRGPGWRNSVRHNLSVNDCFVKLSRCEDGRGHYWGVHHAHLGHFEQGNFKRSRRARGRRDGLHWVAPTDPCRICWCLGHQLNFSACIQPWWVGGFGGWAGPSPWARSNPWVGSGAGLEPLAGQNPVSSGGSRRTGTGRPRPLLLEGVKVTC